MWLGVLNHVCGEHSRAGGSCKQDELQEEKPPMRKDSKEMDALRDVILDKKLLKSLKYYTNFRVCIALEHVQIETEQLHPY